MLVVMAAMKDRKVWCLRIDLGRARVQRAPVGAIDRKESRMPSSHTSLRGLLNLIRVVHQGLPPLKESGHRSAVGKSAPNVGLRVSVMLCLKWSLLVLVTLEPSPTHALGEFIPAGARSAGMGDAYVGLAEGAEGLLWNPGSVSMGGIQSAMVSYYQPFGIPELESVAAAFVIRYGSGALGIQHQGLTTTTFSEASNSLVAGWRVAGVGAGLRMRFIQTRASGRVGHDWVVFDLGLLIRSSRGIGVGMVGWNIGGTKTAILGQGGMVGLAVTRATTTLTVDVQKEAGTATGGAVGVAIQVSTFGQIRLGVGGHPERLTLGVGVRKAGAEIDYGILFHTVLGFTHRASVAFSR